MVPWAKALTVMPGNLGSIFGTHMVEGEKWRQEVGLGPLYMCALAYAPTLWQIMFFKNSFIDSHFPTKKEMQLDS